MPWTLYRQIFYMKIYLVQRAEINRPLNDYSGKRFSHAVDLDYMGSSEFEWGATAKGLRDIQAHAGEFKITSVRHITREDKVLRIYHKMTDDQLKEYTDKLTEIWEQGMQAEQAKERTHFYRSAKSYELETDLWWDLLNCVIWSFDKNFMMRLTDHLEASWKYMDEQKALKNAT